MGGHVLPRCKVPAPCARKTCTDDSISSQTIYSRFSDIFGRKILLMIAISVFSIGNLLCGFARNLEQLVVFRVIAGLGGGGINVLVLIIVSDIVSLKERGKVITVWCLD
jgi:MFS family permease